MNDRTDVTETARTGRMTCGVCLQEWKPGHACPPEEPMPWWRRFWILRKLKVIR